MSISDVANKYIGRRSISQIAESMTDDKQRQRIAQIREQQEKDRLAEERRLARIGTEIVTEKPQEVADKQRAGALQETYRPDFLRDFSATKELEKITGLDVKVPDWMIDKPVGALGKIGQAIQPGLTELPANLMGLIKGGTGVLEQGVRSGVSPISLITSPEARAKFEAAVPTSKAYTALDKPIEALKAQAERERQTFIPKTGVGRFAESTAESLGAMAPAVVAGPVAGALFMGASSGGSEYLSALKQGATPSEAAVSAGITGGAEALLSSISLGFLDKAMKGVGANKPLVSKGIAQLKAMLGEAGEEAGTEVMQFLGRKITYDQDAKLSLEDVAKAAGSGALMAMFFGALGSGNADVQQAVEDGNVTKEVITKAVVDEGIATEQEVQEAIAIDKGVEFDVNKLNFLTVGDIQNMTESDYKKLMSMPDRVTAGKELSSRMGETINKIQQIREELRAGRQQELDTAFKSEPVKTAQPTQTISQKADATRTKAAEIEGGEGASFVTAVPETTAIEDVPQDLEPIDTKTRVLTETPRRIGAKASDVLERAYQEIFSQNVPFEKIGGQAKVQGSNINRLQGTIEHNVVGKQTDMQGRTVGDSVVDIFETIPKDSKRNLFDYMLNKHNIDRFAQNKPVFGETVTSETSQDTVNKYEQSNPEFVQTQQKISNYFKNLMNEWGVKSGMVSQETADMLAERYPNYVPTYRAKDFPKSLLTSNKGIQKLVKTAKGGEDFILPVDQQMIALTQRTITNARRNELMNTLAKAYDNGLADRYISNITDSDADAVTDVIDVGNKFDSEPVVKGNDYIVEFYTDGKPRKMTVNKTLYKALDQSVSDDGINKVAQIVKKYAANPFKNLITGYNPIFAASNIMRDVPTALTYSDNPINMTKQVPEAVKEILTNGEKFQLFKAMGGTREGLIGSGKEFRVPNMNESSKVIENVKKFNPIKTVGDINGFTETLPRFSEFLNVLEKTGDPALAVYKSAELTTDFSRHGKLTKLLDNFVPYLNPSVQGIDKFRRSMVENPLKAAAKGLAVITLPTMLLDLINRDDEEYNNLSPRERNLYFNVPFETPSGEKKFLRIPKSRELGVAFSSIYEWAARAARGQKVTGEEIVQTVRENFTPADINSPIWTPALKAWKQIQDPDAYETNYWGGLIVPLSQRKYSPGEQYDANSSGVAKAIGQQFGISPYVVDYLIKSYTGIIGQVVQPIGADKVQSKLAPLERKFINDPVFKADSVNQFYELLDSAKKEAQDYNKRENVPSKVVTPLERTANQLQKISTQMSKVRAQQKDLQKTKGNEDRVKELQRLLNSMAAQAIEKYD